jgi:hypothetical protein
VECRELYKYKLTDLQTGEDKEVLADSYGIWEDLGNGYLQPVSSTQNVTGLLRLKKGQAVRTMSRRFERLDNSSYYKNTSMNNMYI